MSLEKDCVITKHTCGLVEKVTYRQNLISVPGKDASLDGEVKSAGVQALDFTEGPCQVSPEVLMATEKNRKRARRFMELSHPEWGKTTVIRGRNKRTYTTAQIIFHIHCLVIFIIVLDFKMRNPYWPGYRQCSKLPWILHSTGATGKSTFDLQGP